MSHQVHATPPFLYLNTSHGGIFSIVLSRPRSAGRMEAMELANLKPRSQEISGGRMCRSGGCLRAARRASGDRKQRAVGSLPGALCT